jgi:hypothetical protein
MSEHLREFHFDSIDGWLRWTHFDERGFLSSGNSLPVPEQDYPRARRGSGHVGLQSNLTVEG